MKIKYSIQGLDCADCALELEELLKNTNGVISASVNFITSKIILEVSEEANINDIKKVINSFEEVKIVEDDHHEEFKKHSLIHLLASIFIYVLTFVLTKISVLEQYSDVISYVGFGLSYIIVGYKVLLNTVLSLKNKNFFDENFLMTIASIGAIVMSVFKLNGENQMAEAVSIMILYQLGEFLQSKAINSSRKSIKDILELKVVVANKVNGNDFIAVKPEELEIGDTILIKQGEKVPVDSSIVDSGSSFDTKYLTGEALPKFINAGEIVLSGYVNVGDNVKAKVIRTFDNSAVSKIIDSIENASSTKSNSEKFITKFAKVYTPIVCLISFIILIIGTIINTIISQSFTNEILGIWLSKAISILVISCPCALVISIPLSYFLAIGSLAKKGVLVKGANKLDDLLKCDIALFDKTGTLTYGKFAIINSVSEDKEKMDSLVSALEKQTNHPISIAFKNIESSGIVTDVVSVSGKGIKGYVDSYFVLAGSERFLEDNNIEFKAISSPNLIIYCAIDNTYVGYYEIADIEKENISLFINELHNNNYQKTILLTGDKENRALSLVSKYNIDECYSELLPLEKSLIAKKYQENSSTIYIGDGINDIPVMANSTVSFSMGGLGSDSAISVSDFVISSDDLMGVIDSIKVSKKCQKIVIQNIIFSISIKVIIMIFASVFVLPLWIPVLADVGVMLLAVLNSLRVRI